MIRKLEKVEISMQDWNGSKKMDPVQNLYVQLTTSIKQLCENPQICSVLLENLRGKKKYDDTDALKMLRIGTSHLVSDYAKAQDSKDWELSE